MPPSLPPSLSGWEITEPVPDAVGRQDVSAAMAAYDAALTPADLKARAVLIKRLFDFARAFNIPADPAVLSPIYLDALADLPVDLLAEAVKDAVTTWRWHNAMPTPAELRAPISAELGRRKRERGRLQLALQRLPAKPRDRSSVADQQAAHRAFAEIRQNIAAVPPVRVMERRRNDHREPGDTQHAVKRGREMLTGLSLDERVKRATGG